MVAISHSCIFCRGPIENKISIRTVEMSNSRVTRAFFAHSEELEAWFNLFNTDPKSGNLVDDDNFVRVSQLDRIVDLDGEPTTKLDSLVTLLKASLLIEDSTAENLRNFLFRRAAITHRDINIILDLKSSENGKITNFASFKRLALGKMHRVMSIEMRRMLSSDNQNIRNLFELALNDYELDKVVNPVNISSDSDTESDTDTDDDNFAQIDPN